MSEYMEQHSVSRMIGSPPGYVGHEEGGQLTEAVRRRPYCVVLFDEVEKAHKKVFGVLLQLLDDGRLTDGQGRTVDFSNVVVIMTSNLGAEHLLKGIKSGDTTIAAGVKERVMIDVRRHFAPEFLNRLDDITVFNPLSRANLRDIVQLQMKDLIKRLKDKDIVLTLTQKGADYILDEAYNPVYGARPLRRFIEKELAVQLSRLIVSDQLPPHSVVAVDAKNGVLSFDVQPGAVPNSPSQKANNPTPQRHRVVGSTYKPISQPQVEELSDEDMDEVY
jgi:ATP-dependent Clp protease ATP-binding subunit ClpB